MEQDTGDDTDEPLIKLLVESNVITYDAKIFKERGRILREKSGLSSRLKAESSVITYDAKTFKERGRILRENSDLYSRLKYNPNELNEAKKEIVDESDYSVEDEEINAIPNHFYKRNPNALLELLRDLLEESDDDSIY